MGDLGFPEFVQAVRRWDESERHALLRVLLVDGIGPVLARRLLAHFHHPQAILKASEEALCQVPGIGRKLAHELRTQATADRLERELQLCAREQVRILWASDPDYPPELAAIPVPPLALWVRGQLLPRDRLAVAVVGSRAATAYGTRQTERLAGNLASIGFTIVSGLARGIDASAHRAALRCQGRTIAVLASGLHAIYPPEHLELAERIAEHGALLSENPMTRAPKSGLFPMRNRIISGLSLGVLVVEAARRSGALITVSHALEQGRDVFAVPGPVDSPLSQGCHQLIKDGAWLVETPADIFDVLRPQAARLAKTLFGSPARHPFESELNDTDRRVLDALSRDALDCDQLTRRTGLPPHTLGASLTRLELRHFIRRLPGGRYQRC